MGLRKNSAGRIRKRVFNLSVVMNTTPSCLSASCSSTISLANRCINSTSAVAQRVSIRILRLSRPAELLESLAERRDKGLSFQVALGVCHKHIDPPHPLRLLRARGEGPRRRACERRDELASPRIIEPHSSPPVRGPYRILSLPRQPHGQRRQCVQGSVRLNEKLSA
jgi:hypothetical protein